MSKAPRSFGPGEPLASCSAGRILVSVGDITLWNSDAIVNAANSSLLGGGGVDGAIHRAGGPDILTQCRTIRERDFPDGLPTGQAVSTTGGSLPSRFVIHTVGPIWHGGNKGESAQLASAYRNSLSLAASLECRSLAFPALSTGVYGYPKPAAARVAYDEVADCLTSTLVPEIVEFVFFSPSDAEIFLTEVQDRCH